MHAIPSFSRGLQVAVCITATLLIVFSTSAEASSLDYAPGFWAGTADGFLALFKLLVSPVAAVAIVDPAAATWHYDAGYYLGVLSFAGTAGMAAATPASEPANAKPIPRPDTLRVPVPGTFSSLPVVSEAAATPAAAATVAVPRRNPSEAVTAGGGEVW